MAAGRELRGVNRDLPLSTRCSRPQLMLQRRRPLRPICFASIFTVNDIFWTIKTSCQNVFSDDTVNGTALFPAERPIAFRCPRLIASDVPDLFFLLLATFLFLLFFQHRPECDVREGRASHDGNSARWPISHRTKLLRLWFTVRINSLTMPVVGRTA